MFAEFVGTTLLITLGCGILVAQKTMSHEMSHVMVEYFPYRHVWYIYLQLVDSYGECK